MSVPVSAQVEHVTAAANPALYQCPNECSLPELTPSCSGEWSDVIAIWFPRNGQDACLQDLRWEEDAWCSQRGDRLPSCCQYDNAASCADGGMAEACTCKGKGRFAYYDQCDGRDPAHGPSNGTTQYCCDAYCTLDEAPPPRDEDVSRPEGPAGTPIVIDLDGGTFRFTSVDQGVWFDLDADGAAEAVSWTRPGSGAAFLVLDRNRNGWVDGGNELFGDRTPQMGKAERHGYRALTLLDHPSWGGNMDGWVSAEDHLAALLRLWIDANHDGISQPSELFTLEERGVEAISLDPVVSNRRDRHGNRLRWVSHVRFSDGGKRPAAADVILLTADP